LFGIPKECLPSDWTQFYDYFSAMLESDTLSVSKATRSMARRLITGTDLWLPVPGSYQHLTIALLPSQLRGRFGFPDGALEQREIRRLIAPLRRVYPLLPRRLQYVGTYQEAEQRLAGRLTPDFVTQMCNRFWIGRAELPAACD
jgi:uncharacterized protein (DUF2236 family)